MKPQNRSRLIPLVILIMTIIFLGHAFPQNQKISVAGYDLLITGEVQDFELDHSIKEIEKGLTILTLTLTAPSYAAPSQIVMKWSFPAHDVQGCWTSSAGLRKSLNPDWWPSRVNSKLASNAPVLTLFGSDDGNRLTFAVSDALNTVSLFSGIREEDGMIYNQIQFFSERHPKLSSYEVEIRFDRRSIPFHQVLQEVSDWWASHPGYEPSSVPEAARLPIYSTWYSYHQSVSSEVLIKECKAARKMGFRAIIVDDGWQTLDSNRGYAYTGDWEPERIPEMKTFVDAVHDLDMDILLWYAVPLIGEKSTVFSKFKGKYLRYWNGQGAYELDPRYPEVREHVINTYKTALLEWGVDGFKLDFLGRFAANEETVLEAAGGRDYASVNEAADRLMTDILVELRKLNPDVMIEFRQPYTGPLMRKYGNMFRVGDCPGSYVANRVGLVDLRALSGRTAVHSDMIMWHYDEPVETAALQFLNILFAVPQVSVRLADIPKDHFNMIKFYTQYWSKNTDVLLDGKFEIHSPMANYPIIRGYNDKKQIICLYDDLVLTLDNTKASDQIEIINAKHSGKVILDVLENLGKYRYTVKDCLGHVTETSRITLEKGAYAFRVPASGLITLIKGEDTAQRKRPPRPLLPR